MWSHPLSRRTLGALALAAALALPATTLAATITGVVRTEAGVGVGNVEINLIDQCTGTNIFLATNHTAADGSFSVSVANGTYDMHFIPAAGGTLVAGDFPDFVVSANANMGIVTLHPGRLVTGTVLTPSLTAAANVDLKWVNVATDHHTFLTKTLTDAAGQYAVRVPSGTWKIDFRPAAGSTFGDAVRASLVVGASDISGLSDVLKTGFAVTGTVRTKSGNLKLSNVDVSFYDKCTGLLVATSHDNTDINGIFSVIMPAGEYTFTIDPPACDGLESSHVGTALITGPSNLGTFALGTGVLVTGLVLAPNGQPLGGAKLKFYDITAVGNPRQGATHDRTDATGHFSLLVPSGTYDVNVEPPPGVNCLVYHLPALLVGPSGANVGTLQTASGIAVSGHIQGPGAVPTLNVNINLTEHFTRANQRLSNDNSDASGDFTVYAQPGVYDIHYDTPACDGLASGQQDSVTITAPIGLPTANLVPGVHVIGTVSDPAAFPVASVNLDVYPAGSAAKLYTPNAKTTATGTYDVFIPTGSYDFRYIALPLSRLRPVQSLGVAVASALTMPPCVLPSGWLVSGVVVDNTSLLPILGVTINFYPHGLLPALWTPHHVTDALGAFTTAVDGDVYDIQIVPPVGSGLAEGWLHGVTVSADLALGNLRMLPPSAGVGPGVRAGLSLSAPSPNPARAQVSFTFAVPEGESELTAWDIAGRRVATLWRGMSAAPVTVRWSGTRDGGGALPAGVFLVRLQDAHGGSLLRRVTLLQ